MKEIKILIAYDENNNLINIKDAQNKKKYKCIDCNNIIIPKKGNIKKHHFSHFIKNKCSNESNKHILAKYLIQHNLHRIKFKCCCIDKCDNYFEYINNYNTKQEYTLNNFRIDLMIYNETPICAIEIYNT